MIPDFQNNKWRLKVRRTFPTIPSDRILSLGLQFTSQHLIIQVSATNQTDTWQVAGKIWATSHIFAAPTKFFEHNLELSDRELICLPKTFQRQYSLYYRPPRHFTNVKIKVWEYLGEIAQEPDYSNENINLLLEKVERLEGLINSLIKEDDEPQNPDIKVQEQAAILRIIGRI